MSYDIIKIPSPYYSERMGCPIKALVVHCIGLDLVDIIKGFSLQHGDGGIGVAAHYFIPNVTGQEFCTITKVNHSLLYPDQIPIVQFVDEQKNAWHAGQSWWSDLNNLPGCENTLNPCSIGIEFHAPGFDDKSNPPIFKPFTRSQIDIGAKLIKDIIRRHNIHDKNIVAHSDIAPLRPDGSRKFDPGPLFPWRYLFQKYQIGLFIDENLTQQTKQTKSRLREVGYIMSSGETWTENDVCALDAFQTRYNGIKTSPVDI